ncbi:hypothetical protein L249_1910 [Ophiocordyceps polyrhachis-furcata BCC 54312]|uniref:Methyltransferase domain-containing protein n=1 Tax=Ophiocordyceps polyrhachis-furcata BCC 54312 TaxID=1330021 RepID=A0A367LPR5_9HYPO|nr:hypothetical protein L249_1910 [Ophiocordyceps polyrhachis-furcata BCC 54312]
MPRVRLGDDVRPSDMTATSAESLSSASALSSISTAAVMTLDPPSSTSRDSVPASKPFIVRNGRPYLDHPKLPYPLPSDLAEWHRQSLRTMLLCNIFGAPVCSPDLIEKPPRRVLEVGCGSGFWSTMCHRFYKSRGHSDISFTGIDVVPLWPDSEVPGPDKDMKWTFIKHDISRLPWPVGDKFDLIMVKDMSLAVVESQLQYRILSKYLRFLRPGGTIEIWDSDHVIRMLRPHVPETTPKEQEAATSLGAYVVSANTPLSASPNPFLNSYNAWLERALEARHLSGVPCTLIGPSMLQESDALDDIQSRRLAVPLGKVRWEREPTNAPTDEARSEEAATKQRTLSARQSALRATALLTVVQQVQALEPILRDVSGKSQDEWDAWIGKMMGNLIQDGGASWGECLEVGAWWARKKEEELEDELEETAATIDWASLLPSCNGCSGP